MNPETQRLALVQQASEVRERAAKLAERLEGMATSMEKGHTDARYYHELAHIAWMDLQLSIPASVRNAEPVHPATDPALVVTAIMQAAHSPSPVRPIDF